MRTDYHNRLGDHLDAMSAFTTTAASRYVFGIGQSDPELAAELRSLRPHYSRHTSAQAAEASPAGNHGGRAGQPLEKLPCCVDHYRLTARLGSGGMGVVYRAEHATLNHIFAMKILGGARPSSAHEQRFLYEIEVHRQLLRPGHSGIVRFVHDGVAGRHLPNTMHTAAHGRPYFVMEYLKGQPLTRFAVSHELPLAARLSLLARVCHAVQYIHSMGIIHRDLKPANILVNAAGEPKIIDFGIARIGPRQFRYIPSENGAFIGTGRYASPEQWEGRVEYLTPQSDVFSLGVICMEILSGAPPRRPIPRNRPEPMRRIGADQLPNDERGRVLRTALGLVLSKATDPAESRRYDSAGQLGAELAMLVHLAAIKKAPFFAFRRRDPREAEAMRSALAMIRRLRAERAAEMGQLI